MNSRKTSHFWKGRKMLFCTSTLHGSKTEIWTSKQYITLHVDLKISEFMGMLSSKRKSASTNKINQGNRKLKRNKQTILTKISKCPREMDAHNVWLCTKKNGKIKGHKGSKQVFCSTKEKEWNVFIIWLLSQVRKEILAMVHISSDERTSEDILKIITLFREEESGIFAHVI